MEKGHTMKRGRRAHPAGRLHGIFVSGTISHLCSSLLDPAELNYFLLAHRDFGALYKNCQESTTYDRELKGKLIHYSELRFNARQVYRCIASTGSAMQPQFKLWYCGVDVAFLFKFRAEMRARRSGPNTRATVVETTRRESICLFGQE